MLEESPGRSEMDSLMISIERACVTEQVIDDSNEISVNSTNDYSLECETAVKRILRNRK